MMPDPAPLGRTGLLVIVAGYVYGLVLLGLGMCAVSLVVRALMALGRLVGGW